MECISKSKTKVREYQRRVVNFLVRPENRGLIVAFDTGTGKTLTAVVTSQCLLDLGIVNKVIVVTPVSLRDNFKKGIDAYGGDREDTRYEFYSIATFASRFDGDASVTEGAFFILDEAHEIKKRGGSKGYLEGTRANQIYRSSLSARKVLLLTATPVMNSPKDVINLISIVNRFKINRLPHPEEKFIDGVPVEQYKEILYRNKFAFYSDPVESSDKPQVISSVKEFTMTPKYYKQYLNVQNKKDINFKEPLVYFSGIRRASNSLFPNPKIDWCIDLITSSNNKTLIFSEFIDSGIKIISDSLNARGIKHGFFYGDVKKEERPEIVGQYNNDEFNILLISKAGALGLDLKGTRNVIILETSWNVENETQIIGRAVRLNSHSHLPPSERMVNVYHLILDIPDPPDITNDRIGMSADRFIYKKAQQKKLMNTQFVNELKTYALE